MRSRRRLGVSGVGATASALASRGVFLWQQLSSRSVATSSQAPGEAMQKAGSGLWAVWVFGPDRSRRCSATGHRSFACVACWKIPWRPGSKSSHECFVWMTLPSPPPVVGSKMLNFLEFHGFSAANSECGSLWATNHRKCFSITSLRGTSSPSG